MLYLVLRSFRTFGKRLEKGDVVDEREIRSPFLRVSEGKITPAVSSSTVPAEPDVDVKVTEVPQGMEEDSNKGVDKEAPKKMLFKTKG